MQDWHVLSTFEQILQFWVGHFSQGPSSDCWYQPYSQASQVVAWKQVRQPGEQGRQVKEIWWFASLDLL